MTTSGPLKTTPSASAILGSASTPEPVVTLNVNLSKVTMMQSEDV